MKHSHGLTFSDDKNYNWLSDFVYGGIDGAITTFAVVAGVEGASLSLGIILILGFANLFADGFSMATGKYLSDKSQKEQHERIRKLELEHIKKQPEIEKKEVRTILKKYNFKGKDLERATNIVTSNPKSWVDLMMRNEFSMTKENLQPLKGASATFISFVLIGIIPLIAYLIRPQANNFIIAASATLSALFLVGTIKSMFTNKNWIISGLETALIGGIAAIIAYTIGYALQMLAA